MEWTKSTKGKAAILLIFAFLLYSYKLSYTPVHLNQDELEFSLNAYSIVTTGKSQTGMPFPIYFPHLGLFWSTPFVVYLPALLLLFLPFSEAAVRLSSVTVALISFYLIYKLGQKLFKNKKSTLIACFLMLTSPAMFINSRVLLDNIYTIPFVLAWLLFLRIYLENKKDKYLFFSALSLGIGIHSYHAAKIIMSLYALFSTVYIIINSKKHKVRLSLLFLFVFILPFAIFIPWFLKYPDSLLHQVSYISNFDKSIQANKGLLGVFNLERIIPIALSYLSYLSPELIFFHGDSSLIHSTGKIGVFSYFIIPLFILGVISILLQKRNSFSKFVLVIFATYPLAPAIVGQPERISRGLVVIPLLSLIAAYGFDYLVNSRDQVAKSFAKIIIILIGLHFSLFLRDYFGDYRARSQGWFNYDIPAATTVLINTDRQYSADTIYLDEMTGFVDRYFKFYEIKNNYFVQNVEVFNYQHPPRFRDTSLILVRYDHLIRAGHIEKTITEPNGMTSFYILSSN